MERYNDPHGGLGGVERYRRTHKLSHKKAISELERSDTYTLHKPIRTKFKRRKFIAKFVGDLAQADLLDMQKLKRFNHGYRYILTVIDTLSRFLYMVPIKSKKADDVIKAFKIVFKQYKPLRLLTDRGLEFYAKKVRKFFKPILHHFSTFSGMKAASCERVQRTIRDRLARHFTSTGKYNYTRALQSIVDDYNTTVNRAIKMRPVDVNQSNEADLFLSLHNTTPRKSKYKIGDQVRLTLVRSIFAKGSDQGWTPEVFTISRTRDGDPPVVYVKDLTGNEIQGSFYEPEVQKIVKGADDTWQISKVLKRKKINGKLYLLVRWRGYGKEHDSYIPAENVHRR